MGEGENVVKGQKPVLGGINFGPASPGGPVRSSLLTGGPGVPVRPASRTPKVDLEVPQDSNFIRLSEPQVVRHATDPSVEFSRNGKGDASWCLKVSAEDGNLEAAVGRLLEIDRTLRERTSGGAASG